MRKFLRTAFGLPDAAPAALPSVMMMPVPVIRPSADIVPMAPSMSYLDRGGVADPGSWGNGHVMPMRSADDAVRGNWAPVTGHVRHLVSNTGWISGSIDQFVAYAVGGGLVPNISPAHELLGRTPDWWAGWARELELIFADWATDPTVADARGIHDFGSLQAQALRSWFSTGDVFAVVEHDEARGWRTSINVIDPTRVSTPGPFIMRTGSTSYLDGIEVDEKGRPLAIWIAPLPGTNDHRGTRIPVRSDTGKQLVAHAFIGEPGQVRGISPFASVVEAIRQTVSLSDAMLVAAHAAANVIGTITSDLPSSDVARGIVADGSDPLARMMEARTGWHETLAENKAAVSLGKHGRIFHLSTGERLDMHSAKDHYASFPEHQKALLREISRAAGMPYEMFSLDRKGATYSSGRLGLLDFWSIVEMRRSTLIEPMCRLALASVAEEAISRRFIDYPNGLRAFRANKNAALRARWFGPARPSVDELKSVRAAVERLEAGLTSLAEETASNGTDWEATMRQRAHERDTAESLGLPDTWSSPAPAGIGNGGKK